MYGCESWTVKKAEHRRIDVFELWCWRRLLRVPWTARRSNQSILKEISSGISLEGMMLKLKLQYFGHLMPRIKSLEKTLMLGGIGGRRKRGRQRMRWVNDITNWMHVSLSELWWWTRRPGVLRFMGSQRVGHDWATELNWTFRIYTYQIFFFHFSIGWHLLINYFCILFIVNKTLMNIGVLMSIWISVYVFFGKIMRNSITLNTFPF